MADVVFSNKGALSKPSKASVVLPQFQFPSFELTFSDKTVEEMLKKDSKDWARARTKMGEETAKEYKVYKDAVEQGLAELDAMCKGQGQDPPTSRSRPRGGAEANRVGRRQHP